MLCKNTGSSKLRFSHVLIKILVPLILICASAYSEEVGRLDTDIKDEDPDAMPTFLPDLSFPLIASGCRPCDMSVSADTLYLKLKSDVSNYPNFTGCDKGPGLYVVKNGGMGDPSTIHSFCYVNLDGKTDPLRADYRARTTRDPETCNHWVETDQRPVAGKSKRNLVYFLPMSPDQANDLKAHIPPPGNESAHYPGYIMPDDLTPNQFNNGTLDNPEGLQNCHHFSSRLGEKAQDIADGCCGGKPKFNPKGMVGPALGLLGNFLLDQADQAVGDRYYKGNTSMRLKAKLAGTLGAPMPYTVFKVCDEVGKSLSPPRIETPRNIIPKEEFDKIDSFNRAEVERTKGWGRY